MIFSAYPLFRPGVGLVLMHPLSQKVFLGKNNKRIGFQFPQGGIDTDETEEEALFRETLEEIGTNKISIVKKSSTLFLYKFPKKIQKNLWEGTYVGQIQRWFLCRFEGRDEDINLQSEHHQEFDQWKWDDFFNAQAQVVDFKKNLYKQIEEEFSSFFA